MFTPRKKERRGLSGKTVFPLVTNEGDWVESDRRSIPDRRLGNIHQELLDAANHGTSEYFTNSPSYSATNEDY